MKNVRILLWAVVAVAAAFLAYLVLDLQKTGSSTGFDAEFSLTTDKGQPFTNEDMKGSPHLVFFGFTHCPEICPTTLYETSGWMETLGEEAKGLKVYFISVDPERDTQEVLSSYLSPFSPYVTGLTGSLEEMDKAAKGYHVYYRKVPLEDGGYTMDHTASVYLMKPDGSFMGTIAYSENPETAISKLRRLLSES